MSLKAHYPSLCERCVFITGGATGIGAALVRGFARQNAKVAFVDLDADCAQQLIEDLSSEGLGKPWFRRLDVTATDQLQCAIRDVATELGPLHTVVNNAANDQRHTPAEMTPERWQQCMAVNLDASFFAAQAGAELMQPNNAGSIINLGSINALLGPANMPGYVTAKAGINGLTKALAKDYGRYAIRVNAILPGWVATERQLQTWLTAEEEARWMQQVAIKSRLMPEDIANVALFLAADDSKMISGQCFVVDAGRT